MFKVFACLLTIMTFVFALVSAGLYLFAYGFFFNLSGGDIRSESALLWHKTILVFSLVSFGLFFTHGFLTARALWQDKHSRAVKVSIGTLIILVFFLIVFIARF